MFEAQCDLVGLPKAWSDYGQQSIIAVKQIDVEIHGPSRESWPLPKAGLVAVRRFGYTTMPVSSRK